MVKNYEQAKNSADILSNIGDTIEKWYKDRESSEMKQLVDILNSIYTNLLKQGASKVVVADFNQPQKTTSQLNPENYVYKGRNARVTPTYLNLNSKEDLSDIH